jgi:MFS family permease
MEQKVTPSLTETHSGIAKTNRNEVKSFENQTKFFLLRENIAQPESKYASAQSLALIGLVTFVGDCARGLIYPALWPLCQHLGGSKVDLGWLIASFSIGRLCITSSLGLFSDVYRHRLALILSCSVLSFGALLWAFSPKLGGLFTLYLGQFIMGVGTGKHV